MYYIVETTYVGPNQFEDRYIDARKIEICSTPATGNRSHEPILSGWCGETNGWSVDAHGEYATIEQARAAIAEKFGVTRDSDPNGNAYTSDDSDIVEIYKPGKYEPMSLRALGDWAYSSVEDDIAADTTDARIAELATSYEAELNDLGYSAGIESVQEMMQTRRKELLDALADAENDEDETLDDGPQP